MSTTLQPSCSKQGFRVSYHHLTTPNPGNCRCTTWCSMSSSSTPSSCTTATWTRLCCQPSMASAKWRSSSRSASSRSSTTTAGSPKPSPISSGRWCSSSLSLSSRCVCHSHPLMRYRCNVGCVCIRLRSLLNHSCIQACIVGCACTQPALLLTHSYIQVCTVGGSRTRSGCYSTTQPNSSLVLQSFTQHVLVHSKHCEVEVQHSHPELLLSDVELTVAKPPTPHLLLDPCSHAFLHSVTAYMNAVTVCMTPAKHAQPHSNECFTSLVMLVHAHGQRSNGAPSKLDLTPYSMCVDGGLTTCKARNTKPINFSPVGRTLLQTAARQDAWALVPTWLPLPPSEQAFCCNSSVAVLNSVLSIGQQVPLIRPYQSTPSFIDMTGNGTPPCRCYRQGTSLPSTTACLCQPSRLTFSESTRTGQACQRLLLQKA